MFVDSRSVNTMYQRLDQQGTNVKQMRRQIVLIRYMN
jgi:hypothetical protein